MLAGREEWLDLYFSQECWHYVKYKQPHPEFELWLLGSFPMTIFVEPQMYKECNLLIFIKLSITLGNKNGVPDNQTHYSSY